ncbi:MAG: sugar phosphate isomerase/epimerase [Thiolinea sp.]
MSISFQLYSARNYTPWSEVLTTLAQLGYTQVEGFGPVYDDPAAFQAMLTEHGLNMPTGHFSLDSLEQDLSGVLAAAQTLGIHKIICPWIAPEQRPTESAGWQALAARLAVIGEQVRAAGYGFAWHNHDFEFKPCTDNGAIPMAILLDSVPELEWEADIAWIVRGGAKPLDWIAQYGARITVAHARTLLRPVNARMKMAGLILATGWLTGRPLSPPCRLPVPACS